MEPVVALVGLGRIGALIALQLPRARVVAVDRDRTEARNDYAPFQDLPPGSSKAGIVESLMGARFGRPDRRRFVEAFCPDHFSPALLRRVPVLVVAVDSLRDRQVLQLAGRAAGAVVVNVAGLGDLGQMTVYGPDPEAPCMECELGPGFSRAVPLAGGGAPGCAPSPLTAERLAVETARVVRRFLRGERSGTNLVHRFPGRGRRETYRLTRSPRCTSAAHRLVEWRRVELERDGSLGRVLEMAGLPSAVLLNPIFADSVCNGCGAVLGHVYRRTGAACPECRELRALAWEVPAGGPLAGRPLSALGLPSPAAFRSADGAVWVEVALRGGEPDPLQEWLEGDTSPESPALQIAAQIPARRDESRGMGVRVRMPRDSSRRAKVSGR